MNSDKLYSKCPRVGLVSLGCSKNAVDSEILLGELKSRGFDIVNDAAQAEIIIVNTCGFIESAKTDSIDTILDMAQYKTAGSCKLLVVTGCLSQRYGDELARELPEVDVFNGVKNYPALAERLAEICGVEPAPESANAAACCGIPKRLLTTPSYRAYLRIADGCDNRCTYCAIPLIRGRHVSVPMEELLREAEMLAARGVRELIVIAQDTTYYGLDLYGKRRLAELLRRLCRIDGIEWIRLHYAYPTAFPDEVIEAMASEPKICKYLDIPFQHISDAQLSAMHRRHTKAEAYALVEKLRGAIPDLALRTTLLVGYPGETEADFAELEQFVRDVRFERLGVFAYSEEEGTYSAQELKDDVPEEVKQQRVERIMTLQNDIARENNLRRVGRTERVLIDSRQGDYYVGRTQYDSPEVDQEILIPAAERRLLRGHFYEIRIDGAADYDLYGKAVRK